MNYFFVVEQIQQLDSEILSEELLKFQLDENINAICAYNIYGQFLKLGNKNYMGNSVPSNELTEEQSLLIRNNIKDLYQQLIELSENYEKLKFSIRNNKNEIWNEYIYTSNSDDLIELKEGLIYNNYQLNISIRSR